MEHSLQIKFMYWKIVLVAAFICMNCSVFQAVDRDKDGVISVEEFKLFFECLGLEEKVK
jgi:hypothetical protein